MNRPEQHRRSLDAYARGAVYLEFRSRDARAIDQGDFEDCKPWDKPPVGLDAARRKRKARA